MIAAGLLTKRITLQHLKVERTESGAQRDTWVDEVSCKCRVITPSMADRRTLLANEVVVTDTLTFQTRGIYLRHFNRYASIKHRIRYHDPRTMACRYYQILSIDDATDDLFIMAQLIDE